MAHLAIFSRPDPQHVQDAFSAQRDFMQLIHPHLPLLRRFAQQLERVPHDGEDLLQEVLVKLYERRESLAQIEYLQPWLMRVVHHRFIDRCRQTSVLKGALSLNYLDDESVLHDAFNLPETEVHEMPELQVQRMQITAAVARAIGRLPLQQRAMVQLHDIDGRSLPEIARHLGVSVNTVKSGLSRARCSLRQSLHTFGEVAPRRASAARRSTPAASPNAAAG